MNSAKSRLLNLRLGEYEGPDSQPQRGVHHSAQSAKTRENKRELGSISKIIFINYDYFHFLNVLNLQFLWLGSPHRFCNGSDSMDPPSVPVDAYKIYKQTLRIK
jgi:hypothetical protein